MDARIDTAFDRWGGFREAASDLPFIHGRLHYDPIEGIALDLVEHPKGDRLVAESDVGTVYGRLVDGVAAQVG